MARIDPRRLPTGVAPNDVLAVVGLVSDTHMPERRATLPPALFAALEGVDLLLHAGDVGELSVLDRLSAIAPVISVHGNDDSAEAQRELPYQQLVAVGGLRLLLCHSHEPDPAQERAQRADDAWGPKLERRAARGSRAGAAVVVFGHTHIPLAMQHDGVLLVNPGALASPNGFTRQRLQTVALLVVTGGGACHAVHIDLAHPDRAFAPAIDWAAGFRAALRQVSASIVAPDLAAFADAWPRIVATLSPEARAAGRDLLLALGRRCWDGAQETIGRADVERAMEESRDLAPALREELLTALRRAGA